MIPRDRISTTSIRRLSASEKFKLGISDGGGTAGAPGPPLADGDYGDIVVSLGGTAINIDSGVLTAAGRALVDDANAAAQRTTLGLGTLATQSGTFSGSSSGTNTGDVTLAGAPTYITIAGQVITRGNVDLTNSVTGDLPLANLAPSTDISKLLGRGAAAGAGDFQEISLGANLTMTGTTLAAAAPVHAIVSVTHSDMDLSEPLARGSVLVGTAFPAWKALTPVTTDNVLKFNGTDTVWGDTPTVTHNLLSGTHTDTIGPQAPSAGALIVGASGAGGWTKLSAPGSSFNFLTFDGTDAAWGPLASSEFTVYNALATAYSRWRRAAGGASHDLVLPNVQGAASTFLKNDGSGNLTWDAPASGGDNIQVAGIDLIDGVGNFNATSPSAPAGSLNAVFVKNVSSPDTGITASIKTDNASLEVSASAIRRAALTGDVTAAAGSNATTIAAGAVTYAKMQNVTTNNRLLGRATAGAGVVEEITLGSNLSLAGTTLNAAAGGSGNSLYATVDFGSAFTHSASVTVTGQAWVSGTSKIIATVLSASGKGIEDSVLSFQASVSDLVAATGFNLNVYTPVKAKGTYTFSCIGV